MAAFNASVGIGRDNDLRPAEDCASGIHYLLQETDWAWSCVERACREEYLADNFLAYVAAHDETYGECERCDERHALCGETHLTPVRAALLHALLG